MDKRQCSKTLFPFQQARIDFRAVVFIDSAEVEVPLPCKLVCYQLMDQKTQSLHLLSLGGGRHILNMCYGSGFVYGCTCHDFFSEVGVKLSDMWVVFFCQPNYFI